MTRVELPEAAKAFIVSRDDYEADRKRGFTVVEYAPEGELVIHNPRNPESTFRRKVPAVLLFRCMLCKFDVVDGNYSADPKDQSPRCGLDLINSHLERNQHPWSYTPFDNPYGNVESVTIEGVEDYTKEIEQT